MKFKAWAKDTALRAVKTAAQAAVGALGVDQTHLLNIDLKTVGALALAAAVASILQNLANLQVGGPQPLPGAAPVPVNGNPLADIQEG